MEIDTTQNPALRQLTQRLLSSSHCMETIEHLDGGRLPSSDAVIDILQNLKDLLFPGYRRRQDLRRDNAAQQMGELVDSLHRQLSQQIARSLCHRRRWDDSGCGSQLSGVPNHLRDEGCEIAVAFLETLPNVRELLVSDVQAAYEGDPAANSLDEIIFCYPGLEAVTVYRLAHQLHRLGVPLIPRMMSEWAHMQTGIDIHPGAQIGPSFFIDHGTGVVIGETCEIAGHVKLYQGVTLGALSFPKDASGKLIRNQKRHPTIERHVVIYANATVLGGQTIVGAESIVGASVSLTKSVPPRTVVTLEKPSLRFREAA